ncbi:MAG: exonuclease domain-containing protein [Usitatibacteraceae bacterium]
MLLPKLAIVDLETTGIAATGDRITEIAIVVVENGAVVEEWQSLVNPGCNIPVEIQALTSITDRLVASAPHFGALAQDILARLQGCVFVAHNARFDYGFIKNAFRRLEIPFTAEVLCTVRLSRKLYPEYPSHSLDALITRHKLSGDGRHRALGDARMTWQALQAMCEANPSDTVAAAIKSLRKMPSLPPQLSPGVLDDLPEGPGVYLFYGVNALPIYVGKSVNLRDRIRSHFSSDYRSANDQRLSTEITRIEVEETAGELGALLRESQLVKSALPLRNHRLRKNRQMVFIRLDDLGVPAEMVPFAEFDPGNAAGLYGPFPTKARAKALLQSIAAEHALCWKALGVQQTEGACFARQLHRCKGACVGDESMLQHNLRLLDALSGQRFPAWPWQGPVAIKEAHPDHGWERLYLVDRWCHLGTARDEDELWSLTSSREFSGSRMTSEFDPDIYKVLRKYLTKTRRAEVKLLPVREHAAAD